MLASMASGPRVTRCSLGLYWSRDLCTAGWLGDVILSRSDSERQRNLMIHDQRPLPVYFSQGYHREDPECGVAATVLHCAAAVIPA